MTQTTGYPPAGSGRERVTAVLGLLLLIGFAGLALLGQRFDYNASLAERPTFLLVALLMALGLLWLLCVRVAPRAQPATALLWVCLAMGLGMRLLQWTSPPIYEDDFYRYLWEGASVAHGLNPYRLTPAQALNERAQLGLWREFPETAPADQTLALLAERAGQNLDRVAYPTLATVYPPLAQAGFAAAWSIKPFSLLSWRLLLLLGEGLTLWLLFKLLRRERQPVYRLLIYWWNPVAIVCLANMAHMEALLLPPLLGFIWLLRGRRRSMAAAVTLAVAAGVKLWPLLLAPLLYLRQLPLRQRLAAPVLCLALTPLFSLPLMLEAARGVSGLAAYSQHWERNDFLFHWLLAALSNLMDPAYAQSMARLTVALAVAALALAPLWRRQSDTDVIRHVLWVSAALFLLSPTGYPWYYLWFLPWLCLRPNGPLLALTALLPLYFLRFELEQEQPLLLEWIIAAEFLPILLALLWQYRRGALDR